MKFSNHFFKKTFITKGLGGYNGNSVKRLSQSFRVIKNNSRFIGKVFILAPFTAYFFVYLSFYMGKNKKDPKWSLIK